MMTRNRWMLLVLMSMMLTAGLLMGQASQRSRPTATAVVDVQQLFDALEEKKQIEADLQSRTQGLQKEKETREKEIQALQSDLGILAPGTPAYDQKEEELERRSVEYQAWGAYEQAKLNRERVVQIERIYRKMADAIGRVAKENGYDLVLFAEGEINFRGAKQPDQLSGLIRIRKLLWHADDLDITALVVTKLNNEFVNQAD